MGHYVLAVSLRLMCRDEGRLHPYRAEQLSDIFREESRILIREEPERKSMRERRCQENGWGSLGEVVHDDEEESLSTHTGVNG